MQCEHTLETVVDIALGTSDLVSRGIEHDAGSNHVT